jgi:hypothetical protein
VSASIAVANIATGYTLDGGGGAWGVQRSNYVWPVDTAKRIRLTFSASIQKVYIASASGDNEELISSQTVGVDYNSSLYPYAGFWVMPACPSGSAYTRTECRMDDFTVDNI